MRLWNAAPTDRVPPEDSIWRRWVQDQTDIPPRTRRTFIPPGTETSLINLRFAFKAVFRRCGTLSEPQSPSRTSPGASVPLGGEGGQVWAHLGLQKPEQEASAGSRHRQRSAERRRRDGGPPRPKGRILLWRTGEALGSGSWAELKGSGFCSVDSPRRVDPDDVQVAEVDALLVVPVAAGAAFGSDVARALLRRRLVRQGQPET